MTQGIAESVTPFELEIFGNIEVISPNDYYFLQDSGKAVLKHDTLILLSEKHKINVDKTILEYGIYNNKDNFYFVHRSFGTTKEGIVVDEVGDASPINCSSNVAKGIPAIMSDKRSKDRLLIRLLGIKDRVYSDAEFENTKNKRPTLIESLQKATYEQRLKMAESAILNYGNFKGKNVTIKDAMNLYVERKNDVFAFLVSLNIEEKYPNGNEQMEYLHLCAKIVHKEHKEYIQNQSEKNLKESA